MNNLSNDEVTSFTKKCDALPIEGENDCLEWIKLQTLLSKKIDELGKNKQANRTEFLDILFDQKMSTYRKIGKFINANSDKVVQIASKIFENDNYEELDSLRDWVTSSLLLQINNFRKNNALPSIPIFRIYKEGVKPELELYLVGSCHFGTPETQEFYKRLEPMFDRCQTLVFEADIIDKEVDAFLKQHPDIATQLSGMAKSGVAFAQITKIEGRWGVESVLHAKESFKKKKVQYLETSSLQIRNLAEIAQKVSASSNINQKIKTEISQQFEHMNTLKTVSSFYFPNGQDYFGNLRAMMKSFEPANYKTLVEREGKWLPQIEALTASSEPHMIVVGALHLVGEDGLVNTLRQRGYKMDTVN